MNINLLTTTYHPLIIHPLRKAQFFRPKITHTFGSGAMAAMARAGDGANMAGKVGEALAAVGVEPQGSFFTPRDGENKKGENRFKTWIFFGTWKFWTKIVEVKVTEIFVDRIERSYRLVPAWFATRPEVVPLSLNLKITISQHMDILHSK